MRCNHRNDTGKRKRIVDLLECLPDMRKIENRRNPDDYARKHNRPEHNFPENRLRRVLLALFHRL